uniref:sodium/hydrogen exchanger 3-like isoform X3 n=1 Tax=Styela clava TaxID=7725 RepID=UPI0019393002|nr:sodium/hydrogen exchanger 3-like isoform X3 [Styela clava]
MGYFLGYVPLFTILLLFSILSSCSSAEHDISLEDEAKENNYQVWYHRIRRSSEDEISHDNTTSSDENSHHPERYHVASINWRRVENPFIVCIWIIFAGLAKIVFRSKYMHKVVSRVPESCLLICLGLIVGGIAYAINKDHQIDKLLFNPDTFFLFILPPIVLEAGYFMPKEPFFDNLGSILTYAIIGTIFNAFAIGLSLYGVYTAGLMPAMQHITLLQCLLFGSIISAVDPVAVISVFEEIHVNIVLYICVFGESLLNDGVAVVLYHIFEQYIEMDEILPIDYIAAVMSFFVVVLGGLSLGIIYGYFGSFITKYTVNNRVIEPTFVFVTCYLAYLTAEVFHLSGIIAIVFAGFIMNSYVEHNISPKSHTTVKYGMKMLAGMCETIIFMLLGIAAVSDFWQHWNTGFVIWTLIFITIYRAIGVVVLTKILNYIRLDKINAVDQFVMAYGGLRGAIAFSLVSLTSSEVVPAIKTMVCACIVCILFTSFVQGSTIRPIVELLHVATADEHKETMFEDINMRLIDHLMAGIEDCIGHRGHHYWTQRLTRLNTDYLMKWFVREPYKTHDQVILETFHRINKREAHDMLLEIERGGSSNELVSEKTLANLLLPMEMRRSYSTTSFSSIMRNQSDACIDMRALEMQRQSAVIISDAAEVSDAHHLLKKNMYRPRAKTDFHYKRGEIDTSHTQKRQEQEILIRRRIHNRRKKTQKHRKHNKHFKNVLQQPSRSRNGSFQMKPKTHHHHTVHFSNGHEPVQLIEQTINPLTGVVAPSVLVETCPSLNSSHGEMPIKEEPEDEGITFSVAAIDEPDSKLPDDEGAKESNKENHDVALNKELPWRTEIPSVAICDPRERAGSLHPHYYGEDSEDEEPGTSHNTNNNNATAESEQESSSSPFFPKRTHSEPAIKNTTSVTLECDPEEVSPSVPLLFKPEDIEVEIFKNLAEDEV